MIRGLVAVVLLMAANTGYAWFGNNWGDRGWGGDRYGN
jgi:hypothetical protein